MFPAPVAQNFGRRFVLVKRVTQGAVVTSCQDPLAPCNASAFPSFGAGAVGAFVFYCDAQGYYR